MPFAPVTRGNRLSIRGKKNTVELYGRRETPVMASAPGGFAAWRDASADEIMSVRILGSNLLATRRAPALLRMAKNTVQRGGVADRCAP